MKKPFILCLLLKTQVLPNGPLTVFDSLWLGLMVSKNDTNNVRLLSAIDGADEFTYANTIGKAGEAGKTFIIQLPLL